MIVNLRYLSVTSTYLVSVTDIQEECIEQEKCIKSGFYEAEQVGPVPQQPENDSPSSQSYT